MPIRFRCAHCGQLLGIAESKSGKQVDCPVCGRTVNVPSADGRSRSQGQKAGHDPELTEALSELKSFGDQPQGQIAPPSVSMPGPKSAAGPQAPDSVEPIVNEAPAELRPEPVQTGETAVLIEDVPDALQEENPVWTESLSELSQQAYSGPTQNSVAGESQRLRTWVFSAGALILGLLIGASLRGFVSTSPEPKVESENGEAIAEQRPADVAQDDTGGQPSGTIDGVVKWTATGRSPTPDSDALVLMLPSQRTGSWRLDCRPLRSDAPEPERRALIRALNELGASVAETDAEGNFSLQQWTENDATLIVVSRHATESDEDEMARVRETLDQWFDNPAQLLGRLAARRIEVSENAAGQPPFSVSFP